MVSIAMVCKYMNWDWNTYNSQPKEFIDVVKMIRQLEAEETERNNKE